MCILPPTPVVVDGFLVPYKSDTDGGAVSGTGTKLVLRTYWAKMRTSCAAIARSSLVIS